MLFADVVSKLAPVIVTEEPTGPDIGFSVKIARAGGGGGGYGARTATVFRNTETVLAMLLETARSGRPSPSKSPIAGV